MKEYVLAIDNGTTSTRCIAFKKDGTMALDKDGKVIVRQYEYEQIMPQPGWCEHDPIAIWGTAKRTAEEVTEIISKMHGCPGKDKIAALGITNQRETTIVWNKKTGEPIHNGVVWLDTRTEAVVQELQAGGKFTQDRFRAKTGLPIATYFSGLKLKWLIDNVPAISEAGEDALFGTVDTWLLWCITGGPGKGLHMTDVSNASRTMMIDLSKTDASGRPAWDPTLMAVFGAKPSMMPKIVDSSGGEHESGGYGPISGEMPGYAKFGCKGLEGVPVGGMLGDQQAALFGQACYQPGEAKCTYGTGCFLLLNTGDQFTPSSQGLLTTAAYKIKGQPMQYALEGSVAIAGALTQWLRDNLKMIGSAPEVEELANKVEDNGGIYFVPAFSGLYAPYWRPDARGAICGMTRFVNNNHVARAAIEAVCYQACDVFDAMSEDTGEPITTLKVDGGMTANKLLLQFQSDMLACDVSVPVVAETTALGSAYAAGLAVGFWKSKDEMLANWAEKKRVTPQMDAATRQKYSKFWKKAVSKTLDWVELDGEGTKPATAKPGPRQSTFGSTNAMDGAAGALDMKVALMEKKLDAVLDLLKKSAPAA